MVDFSLHARINTCTYSGPLQIDLFAFPRLMNRKQMLDSIPHKICPAVMIDFSNDILGCVHVYFLMNLSVVVIALRSVNKNSLTSMGKR